MDSRDGGERRNDPERQASPSLKAAVRRARIAAAAHSEAVDDLRRAEVARLEILEDAIRPTIEQAARVADLFDIGIALSEKPRLFLDMIAYVDLGPDRRSYRFHQNTRHGRVLIAESADPHRIVAAMTNYVARRLIEREQALAADTRIPREPPHPKSAKPVRLQPPAPEARRGPLALAVDLAGFLLMTLGAFFLFALAALGAWLLWSHWGQAMLAARFGAALL